MRRIRIPVLLLLFTVAAVVEAGRLTSLSAIAGADVWWHLSSGLWILEHHTLPHGGIFSQVADGAWIAASWAYDLLLAAGYRLLDVRAIPVLLMGFKAALAVVTFMLAGGLRGKFWPAVGLSAIAQYVLGAVPPGPTYFSILFFGAELWLLLESRRRPRALLWLPGLMLVWANFDVQFGDGVAVLLIYMAVLAGERFGLGARAHSSDFGRAAAIVGIAIAATLVTPYFYRPYGVFFATTFSSANQYLGDFLAPGFRQPQDYVLMLVAMAAFLALGLRRSRDPFAIAVLVACVAASFYSKRDIWLVMLAALAVIGEAMVPEREESPEPVQSSRALRIAVAAAVVVLAAAAVIRIPRSRDALMTKVSEGYPVAACEAIRERHLGQPLFNAYEWGGFLTWYLPQYPVAIDGRNELYGADFITEYSKVMNADVPYTEYPALTGAQTILLPKGAIMAGALGSLPAFKVAYSDDAAVVLTRTEQP